MTGIDKILNVLKGAMDIVNIPIEPLPPPLVLTGANIRPGLSARNIASRIIQRQSEAGAPQGAVFSEGENISEKMELIRIEEILYALLNESKIEIAIPPASIQVSTVGVGNLGIPIITSGANTNIVPGVGVIR
jgi:hypothetical protein